MGKFQEATSTTPHRAYSRCRPRPSRTLVCASRCCHAVELAARLCLSGTLHPHALPRSISRRVTSALLAIRPRLSRPPRRPAAGAVLSGHGGVGASAQGEALRIGEPSAQALNARLMLISDCSHVESALPLPRRFHPTARWTCSTAASRLALRSARGRRSSGRPRLNTSSDACATPRTIYASRR